MGTSPHRVDTFWDAAMREETQTDEVDSGQLEETGRYGEGASKGSESTRE